MALELPSDLTTYTETIDAAHSPGAYALRLSKPDNLEEAWHRHNDTKPPYWDLLADARTVVYVGGTGDLLSRLEDHRDGDVRQTNLTQVCEIERLEVVWLSESREEAVNVDEVQLARWLADEHPEWFVHQR